MQLVNDWKGGAVSEREGERERQREKERDEDKISAR